MAELLGILKELAGELVIVVLFLHYLRSRDKTYDDRLGRMTELFTATAKEGHDVASKLGEALVELRTTIVGRK